MSRLAVSGLALLIAACSGEPPAASHTESPAEATTLASDAAAATDPIASTPSGPQSRYTSLKDCKVAESGESAGEDWSVSRCAGLAGWHLLIDYGDARDDLQLVRAGMPAVKLGLPVLGGGGFNSLGDTVEWRGIGEGAAFKPAALIVRNSTVKDPERPERPTALLVVVDLTKHCVVAQVEPMAGQNEQARAIADGPSYPCIGEKEKPQ